MRVLKLLILVVAVCSQTVVAQSGTNNWINYNQTYYKIPILETGIYKITYNDLQNALVDVANLDPREIQIFAHGEEQYIHVEGEGDLDFGVSDYVEFYAEKNDGYFDSTIYNLPEDNPNPYYSSASDTIYYFLTFSNANLPNKRMVYETDLAFGGYTQEAYYIQERVAEYHAQYGPGKVNPVQSYIPEYTSGEGWVGGTMGYGGSKSATFTTSFSYNAGPDAEFDLTVVGLTNYQNKFGDHKLFIKHDGTQVLDTIYEGHSMIRYSYKIPPLQLASTSTVTAESDGTFNTNADRSAVGYMRVRYARTFNMDGGNEVTMEVNNGGNGKSYLKVTNFDDQSSQPWLYDVTNHKRVLVQKSGSDYNMLVPNGTASTKKCLLTSEANFKSVNIESAIYNSTSFKNYEELSQLAGGYDYYIITTKDLLSSANNYKAYRNSTGFNAAVIDLEELYMQYSDGIRKHPMAIRGFAKDIIKDWGEEPKYFFLIGKSVQTGHPDAGSNSKSISKSSRQNSVNWGLNKVPTFGYPGSDVYLTAAISDTSIWDPDIPIGRLSALNDQDVEDYLAKVQEYESNSAAEWMKQVMHFGGGTNASQSSELASYLKGFEKTIVDTLFGAHVSTYLKSSSDPLQINVSDSIRTTINSGTSIMCFFAHAYGSNFDINVDGPDYYDNKGRYPLIIANSCLIGNIHLPGSSSGSEIWVNYPEGGAIGFLASVSLGVATTLNKYTGTIYENLGKDMYGQGLGDIMQQTIREIQDPQDIMKQDVCMLMTLHADPAIIINSHDKPDYTIFGKNGSTQPQVYFNPSEVTSEIDSFDVNVVITNIGKAIGDSINVSVTRDLPGTTVDTLLIKQIVGVKYRDTVSFRFPVDFINGLGQNSFEILAESDEVIDELDESNNGTTMELFIKSGDLVPIWPYKYAVIPDQQVTLKASTGDPLSEEKRFVFQIDTNENFSPSSAAFYQASITQSGGVVKWDPSVDPGLAAIYSQFPESNTLATPTVFYWRCSLDSVYTGSYRWKQSTFQYVKDNYGWGQSHRNQLADNDFTFITFNEDNGEYIFEEHKRKLEAEAKGNNIYNKYSIDGSLQSMSGHKAKHMVMIAVIDGLSLKPWEVIETPQYGQVNFPGQWMINNGIGVNDKIYWFIANDQTFIDGMNTIIAAANDGDYILMYNYLRHYMSENLNSHGASSTLFRSNMQALGADVDSLDNYSSKAPYILFAKKGDPGFAMEVFGADNQSVELEKLLSNNWVNGTVESPLIGPAAAWQSMHWNAEELEVGNVDDTLRFDVYGVDASGQETWLHTYEGATGDHLDLGTIVDANLYPYIRLEYFMSDEGFRTPHQLDRLQVLYQGVPEAALNANVEYSINSDSLQEGHEYQIKIAIENITDIDMDSVQVKYWIIDKALNNLTAKYKMLPPLLAGDIYVDTITSESLSLIGDNRLWYEVNPYDGPVAWQKEQYHFNNIFESSYEVYSDKQNPLLDVTFDGIHILNGDFVSPKTKIVIQLTDENQFLALDDPSLYQVMLERPQEDGTTLTQIYNVGDEGYTFIPASLPENKARVEIEGDFFIDGDYQLQVQAMDKSSNVSGSPTILGKASDNIQYKADFKVEQKSTITEVLNYPNPFTTSTQFVFTLTGSEIPDEFRIQIMTITGKVVKEIHKDEIGPINIGRNITEYKWDGTDEFGDLLANGVYLYRVVVKDDGEEVENRKEIISTAKGDIPLSTKYFKAGFGKMYIMR